MQNSFNPEVKESRPRNLDQRVFFCEDCPNGMSEYNLLWLYINKKDNINNFQWVFEFDISKSGVNKKSVAFTEEESNQLIDMCESKPFDWNYRSLKSYCPREFLYTYSKLDDAVYVANKVTEFAYKLHNDDKRKLLLDKIYESSYKSGYADERIHIYGKDIDGQYLLFVSKGLKLEILLFKNSCIDIKREVVTHNGFNMRIQAIKELNPSRKDGVLLVSCYKVDHSKFYATDWNTFCLTVDRSKYGVRRPKINYVYDTIKCTPVRIKGKNRIFNSTEKQNLFPDEVDQSINNSDVNIHFREGAISQVLVNAYERNPQARQKCIEHYGTSCFVCGFNFGKVFGELGEGFIHVHHLKPISEVGEEYKINPIEDMRPVCPNCHAIIHRQTPLLSIEEIQSLLQKLNFYKFE